MPLRKPLAAALLLLAAAPVPQLLWLGAALGHHEHAEETAGHEVEWLDLAKALVHGHEHAEGVPDHEHRLLPAPPLRADPPRDLQAPVLVSLEAPDAAYPLLSGSRTGQDRFRLPGAGPPRLHLLCILLI